MSRPLRATACGALIIAILAVPVPAAAHDRLESSTPADGASLSRPPASVTLRYSRPVLGLGSAVRVSGPSGVVSTGSPQVDGSTVIQRLAADAPSGRYTVQWRVTSADGHPISGEFGFAVGRAGSGGEPSPSDAPSATAASSATAGAPSTAAAAAHPDHGRREGLINRMAGSGALLVLGGLGVAGLGLAGLLRTRRGSSPSSRR